MSTPKPASNFIWTGTINRAFALYVSEEKQKHLGKFMKFYPVGNMLFFFLGDLPFFFIPY